VNNNNKPQIDVKIIPVSKPPIYKNVSSDELKTDQIKIDSMPSAKTKARDTTKKGKN